MRSPHDVHVLTSVLVLASCVREAGSPPDETPPAAAVGMSGGDLQAHGPTWADPDPAGVECQPTPGPRPSTTHETVAAYVPGLVGPLILNEVMPSNGSYVMDEASDYDDWVEVLNPSHDEVQLEGWGLSDSLDEPASWWFPPMALPPGGRVVVWLDDEPDEGPLHADFRADADAESVVLWQPSGSVADVLAWQEVGEDLVVGRFPDGGDLVSHSIRATPGNPNPADPGPSRDASDALFPEDHLIVLELYLDDDAYDDLMNDSDARVEGAIAFESSWINRVEVSIKGSTSRRSLRDKAAFKIDLNQWVAGQRLRGLKKLTLNNMVQDDSLAHETITYRFFREAGLPAPRTGHVLLYLNGAFRGIYLNVETPDDRFLERWYDDSSGNLYERASGADLDLSKIHRFELDEHGSNGVTDRSDLRAVAELLEHHAPSEGLVDELEALVDVDQVVRHFAAEVMVEHWDGYFFNRNNYMLYHEPSSGLLTLLPWGADQTLDEKDDLWRGLYEPEGRLGWWMVAIPSVRDRYDEALEELVHRMIELAPELTEQAWAIHERTLPWYDPSGFEEEVLDDVVDEIEDIEDFLQDQPDAILNKL